MAAFRRRVAHAFAAEAFRCSVVIEFDAIDAISLRRFADNAFILPAAAILPYFERSAFGVAFQRALLSSDAAEDFDILIPLLLQSCVADNSIRSDEWQTIKGDRQMLGTCGNCRFWQQVGDEGFCCFNPPIIVEALVNVGLRSDDNPWNGDHIFNATAFPITHTTDWCGKHEPLRES